MDIKRCLFEKDIANKNSIYKLALIGSQENISINLSFKYINEVIITYINKNSNKEQQIYGMYVFLGEDNNLRLLMKSEDIIDNINELDVSLKEGDYYIGSFKNKANIELSNPIRLRNTNDYIICDFKIK